MNPITQLYRRSRSFRIVLYMLAVPLWALLAFICINAFSHYTQFGNDALLLIVLGVAGWGWWYGDDRERRRAASTSGDGDRDSKDWS
jgi:hypothetical protein